MPLSRPARALGALALVSALLTSCSSGDGDPSPRASDRAPRAPRAGAAFDYQLGGAYPPPEGVRVVSRDRAAKPVPGRYTICYVNAFQAQPGGRTAAWWRENHPGLLLRDADGELVIDEDWKEPLLDISTAAKREALLTVVGPWIDGCARAGFDAVEPDNLDSYARSDGHLKAADGRAFARLLVRRAHEQGLAIAQKNTTEFLDAKLGFDFAVAEECGQYGECGDYAAVYGRKVFDIEYEKKGFEAACRRWGGKLSIVLRDRDVSPAGEGAYVYRRC
ncbi:endo alpha-1,4 polygalactosaminidase [Streptomyces sp. AN091965]|uniref:endo alpha-1,4 polygalactosaminidase n=1 Tax=Streptomyces sp. AN091965 TaxID=2927803 RepID=UPI001F602A63|nr:endo alpha-1,4 polygalactosaminidase [Streptomyces sp. AN091965]MCI3930878.1 endo alpha-1,4 polygalactosaminidase [Streptomyces sp. AN091965]